MKIDFVQLAAKLPAVISGTMAIVEKIKDAHGAAKKDAVLEAIPESVTLLEFGINKDLLNDPVIKELVSAYIDGEALAKKTEKALREGILARVGNELKPAA